MNNIPSKPLPPVHSRDSPCAPIDSRRSARHGSSRRRGIIQQRPLAAFFALAFALSWLAWMPYLLSDNGIGVLHFSVPGESGTRQLLGILPGAYLGPVTAAFIVTALVEGRAGLAAWARRFTRLRVGWKWYLGVLLWVPIALLATTLLFPATWDRMSWLPVGAVIAYIPMLVVQIFTTSLAEEPGWRDFALPRLQRQWGALRGTLVLGLLWGAWHGPLFLTDWAGTDVHWWEPVLFVLSCVPLSLVMTWVFNKTGQSIPMVMLLHAGINNTFSVLWPEAFPDQDAESMTILVQLVASTGAAIFLIVRTRGRLGLDASEPTPLTARHEPVSGSV